MICVSMTTRSARDRATSTARRQTDASTIRVRLIALGSKDDAEVKRRLVGAMRGETLGVDDDVVEGVVSP